MKRNRLKVKRIPCCRSCGHTDLVPIISLGTQAVSAFVNDTKSTYLSAPLSLTLCNGKTGGCSLIQLAHSSMPPDLLYRNYWYRSGVNSSMKQALTQISQSIQKAIKLGKGDVVLDIGANDGTLLRSYTTPGVIRAGFEPAHNLQRDAASGTDLIIPDFFTAALYRKHFPAKTAKVITTIAMFYDVENINSFVNDIKSILSPEGIWVNQMAYLPAMLANNMFDNICHEHLTYFSLTTLQPLLNRHGLTVCHVEQNEVNGGSFRVYITPISAARELIFGDGKRRVQEMLEAERLAGLDKPGTYSDFARRIGRIRRTVTDFIRAEKTKGKTVYAYGASTKGNTLLQYFGLDSSRIGKISERNPDKWGKRTVATKIPIVSEAEARRDCPDYFLVLPWHFREEFINREIKYLKRGGRLLFPLPTPEVVSYEHGKIQARPVSTFMPEPSQSETPDLPGHEPLRYPPQPLALPE